YVADPCDVGVHAVDRVPHELHVPLFEFGVMTRELHEFRGAYRSEVRGMRKQQHPLSFRCVITQPDHAVSGLGLEIGSWLVDTRNTCNRNGGGVGAHLFSPRWLVHELSHSLE